VQSIKIREYKIDSDLPETTVTIPLSVFKIVTKIMPRKALDALQQNETDVEEIQKLAEKPEVQGTILEVEEHSKGSKIIISVE